jgi:N-acetylated-alpha-linked acidic dipeptidase
MTTSYRSLYAAPDPFSGYTSWMLPALQYEVTLQSTENLKDWEEEYVTAIEKLTNQINSLTQKLLIPGSGK